MKSSQLTMILLPVTVLAVACAIWFGYAAPVEAGEGLVQKIMYVHVPAAITSYLGLFVGTGAAIGFLKNRRRSWDRVAVSSIEVATVFCTAVLLTGPVWAKPIWGVWWQWDARLTSTLVLWFMLIGYLIVRVMAPDRETAANWSAVVAILACADAYLVHESVKWWRTLHPLPKVFTTKGGQFASGLPDPRMRLAFFSGMIAFAILYLLMLSLRLTVERLTDDVDAVAEASNR